MIQTRQIGQLTQLTASEGYIHLLGSDSYAKSIVMLPTQSIDDYEEVAELPPPPDTEYPKRVETLIRSRYTLDDELAILRQRDTKPREFEAYYAYAEQCKQQAKEQAREQKPE